MPVTRYNILASRLSREYRCYAGLRRPA